MWRSDHRDRESSPVPHDTEEGPSTFNDCRKGKGNEDESVIAHAPTAEDKTAPKKDRQKINKPSSKPSFDLN